MAFTKQAPFRPYFWVVFCALLTQVQCQSQAVFGHELWSDYSPQIFSQCQTYIDKFRDHSTSTATSSTLTPTPLNPLTSTTSTAAPTTVGASLVTATSTAHSSHDSKDNSSPHSTSTTSDPDACRVSFHQMYDHKLSRTDVCRDLVVHQSDVPIEECRRRCQAHTGCEAFQYSVERRPHCVIWEGKSVEMGGACARVPEADWVLYEVTRDCQAPECRQLTAYRNGLMNGCDNKSQGQKSRYECMELCRRTDWCKAAVYKWSLTASCVFYLQLPRTDSHCRINFKSRRTFRSYTFLWLKNC